MCLLSSDGVSGACIDGSMASVLFTLVPTDLQTITIDH